MRVLKRRGKMGTGSDLFLDWEMGFGLLGQGFGHWEWEMKSSKMGMGLR
jgi:hypothetical protein